MSRVLRFDAGTLQKPRRTSQGYLRVDGWASRVGVQEYRNPDGSIRRELREDSAVFDDSSLTGFEGAPVTDDHPPEMVDLKNAKAYTKGTVLSVGRRDGDHVAVSLVITDPDLITKMESGKRQLSTGYFVELDETPGVHPTFGRYDAKQVRVGPVNHLAVVERGRAGTAVVRMDAAIDTRLSAEVPANVVARLDAIARRLDAKLKQDHGEHDQSSHGGGGGGGDSESKSSSSAGSGSDAHFEEKDGSEDSIESFLGLDKKETKSESKSSSVKGLKSGDSSATVNQLAKQYGPGGPKGAAFKALVAKHGLNDEHHNGELHLGANSLAAKAAETAKGMGMKRPTYAQAQTRAFSALAAKGWTVKSNLKVPHATSPDGKTRLWFKSQAVWRSKLGEGGGYDNSKHSLASAGSTFDDLRDYGHSDEGIAAFADRHWKASKTDAAPDLHDAKSVPNSICPMNLDEALTRIKDLESKLDALEAAPASEEAPADGAKCEKCGGALVEGEEHQCAPKMDAADIARLEGERDAARKDAEDAKAAAEKAAADAEAKIAKIRKDSEDSLHTKVRESLDTLTKAALVLGRDAKIKVDGKDVDLLDAPLRSIKCAVVKRVDGDEIPAARHDEYVNALFERAVKTHGKGASSLAATRQVVEAPRQDASDPAPASDPEKAAADAMKNRLSSAWMATDK